MTKKYSTILATSTIGALLMGAMFTVIPAYAHVCTPDTPNSCLPGRMTGGGVIRTTNDATGQPIQITYGYELRCDINDPRQNLEINWDNGNTFKLDNVTAVGCEDDPNISPNPPDASFDTMALAGTGSVNGIPGAFVYIVFQDAGEPGNANPTPDYTTIVIYDASGQLLTVFTAPVDGGNHQAHQA